MGLMIDAKHLHSHILQRQQCSINRASQNRQRNGRRQHVPNPLLNMPHTITKSAAATQSLERKTRHRSVLAWILLGHAKSIRSLTQVTQRLPPRLRSNAPSPPPSKELLHLQLVVPLPELLSFLFTEIEKFEKTLI